MKKGLVFILVILSVMLWAQNTQFGFSTNVQISENQESNLTSDEQLELILENLNMLQYSYLKKLSKDDYQASLKILEEIKAILGVSSAKKEVNETTPAESSQNVNINLNLGGFGAAEPVAPAPAPAPIAEPQPVQQVTVNKPMDSSTFNQLLQQIRSESFSDDQLLYVRTASKKHYFSVDQIGQLIDEFTFSEDKIECLQITYPRVTDNENGFNLIGKFTYAEDKQSAERIVNQ